VEARWRTMFLSSVYFFVASGVTPYFSELNEEASGLKVPRRRDKLADLAVKVSPLNSGDARAVEKREAVCSFVMSWC
jgi:hypothetical protein